MNEIFNNPIVFYPTAIIMILFALLSIYFKNIFYSLLSAILVFFMAGMFFYILGSEYNAVIQIAVYGIAVPVVIGLAIMFTDLKKEKKSHPKDQKLKYLIFFIAGLFISLVSVFSGFKIETPAVTNPHSTMNAFSEGIFIHYVWAFELVSIVLTIIVIGLTMFNKKEEEC